jgi:hypothetical protein
LQTALQQSAGAPHIAPSGAHVPLPQTPFVHWPEQQSADALQSLPSSAQGIAQKPLLHRPLQQSPLPAHFAPMGAHTSTHASFSHRPLQQSLESLHGAFFGMQSQAPLAHRPLQQSLASVHAAPKTPQAAPQKPAVQEPVQHSPSLLHAVPSFPQAGAPHVPSVQAPVQQSFASAQVAPSDLHAGAAQWPLLHSPLQQSDPLSQSTPNELHEAASAAASLGPASTAAPSNRSPRAPQPVSTATRRRAAQISRVRSTRAAYSIGASWGRLCATFTLNGVRTRALDEVPTHLPRARQTFPAVRHHPMRRRGVLGGPGPAVHPSPSRTSTRAGRSAP